MQQVLLSQYQLIQSARLALLDYCASINPADLHKTIPAFNDKSIADMLVHNANTYIHWIVKFDQGSTISYFEIDNLITLSNIRLMFERADAGVDEFLQKYIADYTQSFTKYIPGKGRQLTTTPLQLFTHVTTHEFHHKGQILTMSRLLGYTPVDTDVIRY